MMATQAEIESKTQDIRRGADARRANTVAAWMGVYVCARERTGTVVEVDADNSEARIRWDGTGVTQWVGFAECVAA